MRKDFKVEKNLKLFRKDFLRNPDTSSRSMVSAVRKSVNISKTEDYK